MKSSEDKTYWDQRYETCHSGIGSYGQWADFKLQRIKEISEVSSILDVGFGDLNMGVKIAQLFPRASYLGLDISETALQRAMVSKLVPRFHFKLIENSVFSHPSDLALCLDVLFHITQDEEYENMLKSLKRSWTKFLFLTVYKNECVNLPKRPHIKIREFDPTYFSKDYKRTLIPLGHKNIYLYRFDR